jgi:hypothetical protein
MKVLSPHPQQSNDSGKMRAFTQNQTDLRFSTLKLLSPSQPLIKSVGASDSLRLQNITTKSPSQTNCFSWATFIAKIKNVYHKE